MWKPRQELCGYFQRRWRIRLQSNVSWSTGSHDNPSSAHSTGLSLIGSLFPGGTGGFISYFKPVFKRSSGSGVPARCVELLVAARALILCIWSLSVRQFSKNTHKEAVTTFVHTWGDGSNNLPKSPKWIGSRDKNLGILDFLFAFLSFCSDSC